MRNVPREPGAQYSVDVAVITRSKHFTADLQGLKDVNLTGDTAKISDRVRNMTAFNARQLPSVVTFEPQLQYRR